MVTNIKCAKCQMSFQIIPEEDEFLEQDFNLHEPDFCPYCGETLFNVFHDEGYDYEDE